MGENQRHLLVRNCNFPRTYAQVQTESLREIFNRELIASQDFFHELYYLYVFLCIGIKNPPQKYIFLLLKKLKTK